MGIERIRDEESIFSAALAIEAADQRQAYLQKACRGDATLLNRIEALLEIHARGQSFLEQAASSLQLTLDAPGVVESC